MNTKQAVDALLAQVTKRFPHDRFVPGVLIAQLPAHRNDKNRRVMDGTNKKYKIPAGRPCVYGCIKRFHGAAEEIVLSYKGHSVYQVAMGLSKELKTLKLKEEVASEANNWNPAGTSATYCKFCGRDTNFCKQYPCWSSGRPRPK